MSSEAAFDLTAVSAPRYLTGRNWYQSLRVSELSGGVSSTALLVESQAERFVIKQALPRLRVAQEWLSDPARVFREAAALEFLSPLLPAGAVPRVLFRDDANYLFGMTAAPEGSEPWKTCLMRGECKSSIAEHVAGTLAALITAGYQSEESRDRFGDLRFFNELRLDPYYRTLLAHHPDLAGPLRSLIDDYPRRASTLVHGDYSPKNILVCGTSAMVIDFEAIHYGDPAFDAAFLLNHLRLKAFHMPEHAPSFARLARAFWYTLSGAIPPIPDFERHTIQHLGALLLARMDGKSPVEYIREPRLRQQIRDFARDCIQSPPNRVMELFRL